MDKVCLDEKFAAFDELWSPRIISELNGQLVKAAKIKGEFVWHSHADEDEMFLVVKGQFKMQFRDRTVDVGTGEFIIVPRGVEHCPLAEEECHIMLFEPGNTKHTGEIVSERTVNDQPWI